MSEEAIVMLETFRVVELRSLLSLMGKSNSGLKKDMLKRVKDVLQQECTPELMSSIRRLHMLRQSPRHPRSSLRTGQNPSNSLEMEHIVSIPQMEPESVTLDEPQMMQLSFYRSLQTIMPPTSLVVRAEAGVMQNSEFMFHLSADQRSQIQKSQDSVQVVLRVCYSESIGIEEDQFPPNLSVTVNHTECPVKCRYSSSNPGTEPSKPCSPINLTPWIFLDFTNCLMLTWKNFGKCYSAAVYLVRLMSSQQLLLELCGSSQEALQICRNRVSEKLRCDLENEVSTTGHQVSLICPLAKKRMSSPCRAVGCEHLQCFDAYCYLQVNQQKSQWACPVCHKYAPFKSLLIDSLQQEILKNCSEEVEVVEFLIDSTWRAVTQLQPAFKHSGKAKVAIIDVVDLTQSSSDEEDPLKEEVVSARLDNKSVRFRKSRLWQRVDSKA